MYHANINLPVPFVPYDYIDTEETLQFKNNKIDFSKINNQFFEWLSDCGLSCCPRRSRYFSSRPYQKYSIHADSKDSQSFNTKLNIIFDSDGTIMKWYKLREQFNRIPDSHFFTGFIRNYNENQVTEIYTMKCDTSCLLDGSKIHTLINSNNNNLMRKCYSFTLMNIHKNEYISYDEAKERLNLE